MLNPHEIAQEVDGLRNNDMALIEAIDAVSKKYNIRYDDVYMAAVVFLSDLHELWHPNRRKEVT